MSYINPFNIIILLQKQFPAKITSPINENEKKLTANFIRDIENCLKNDADVEIIDDLVVDDLVAEQLKEGQTAELIDYDELEDYQVDDSDDDEGEGSPSKFFLIKTRTNKHKKLF